MKLYKFRGLGSEENFTRSEQILKKGEFYCAYYYELNDPMEGIYYINPNNKKLINKIYDDKNKYRICSFSGKKGLENTLMWGYYANGFRGIAIEIEVDENEVIKIDYVDEMPKYNNMWNEDEAAKKILTSKLKNWEHEYEYRFLTKNEEKNYKIGKINAIFFGAPYSDVKNSDDVYKKKIVEDYNDRKEKLIKIARGSDIQIKDVYIDDGIVKRKNVTSKSKEYV